MKLIQWLLGRRRVKTAAPKIVHCSEHGESIPAFVCQHAISGSRLGFVVSESPNPENPPDGDFVGSPCGWCGECEQVRIRCGGWNDESEQFVGGKVVCIQCFEEIRQRNLL